MSKGRTRGPRGFACSREIVPQFLPCHDAVKPCLSPKSPFPFALLPWWCEETGSENGMLPETFLWFMADPG